MGTEATFLKNLQSLIRGASFSDASASSLLFPQNSVLVSDIVVPELIQKTALPLCVIRSVSLTHDLEEPGLVFISGSLEVFATVNGDYFGESMILGGAVESTTGVQGHGILDITDRLIDYLRTQFNNVTGFFNINATQANSLEIQNGYYRVVGRTLNYATRLWVSSKGE